MVIRTPDQRLRVFVSSTVGSKANWRTSDGQSHVPSGACDSHLCCSSWGRGRTRRRSCTGPTWPRATSSSGCTGRATDGPSPACKFSGLEEELRLARDGALPRLLYVKTPAPDREPRLAELLARITREGSDSSRYFRTAGELGRLVRDDLATLLSERFVSTRTPADPGSVPAPSGDRRGLGPRPLPVGTTSLVGREQAIGEVAGLLTRPEVGLVTLTGPGGVGKTRLALAVGERLRDRFDDGVVFVALVGVTQPGLVVAGIGRAVGTELGQTDTPLEALAERLGDDRRLLVLDNLEQVVEAADDLHELLARCPGVAILATSRTALGLRAEQEYPVPPLPLPAGVPVETAMSSPAVALFVDRARAVRNDFAITQDNTWAVVEICRRLEGLPLAIELAAARTRLLDPDALLGRLSISLDALGSGAVDLPERQRTLRATVDWSVGLLDDAERSLLEILAVFIDGWTVEAAARGCSTPSVRTSPSGWRPGPTLPR
jgi:hypothetical protein